VSEVGCSSIRHLLHVESLFQRRAAPRIVLLLVDARLPHPVEG